MGKDGDSLSKSKSKKDLGKSRPGSSYDTEKIGGLGAGGWEDGIGECSGGKSFKEESGMKIVIKDKREFEGERSVKPEWKASPGREGERAYRTYSKDLVGKGIEEFSCED